MDSLTLLCISMGSGIGKYLWVIGGQKIGHSPYSPQIIIRPLDYLSLGRVLIEPRKTSYLVQNTAIKEMGMGEPVTSRTVRVHPLSRCLSLFPIVKKKKQGAIACSTLHPTTNQNLIAVFSFF